MNKRYEGKTVLITGAASGIGREIARAAAAEGGSLILGDIQEAPLMELCKELEQAGSRVHAARCDVSVTADVEALVSDGAKQVGAIDVVFANAGVLGTPGDMWDCEEAEFQRILNINVVGAWRTLRAVLPGMIERGSGNVVVTASAAGVIGPSGLAAYVASKHAVLGLVKSTAMNVAAQGIRVNAFCPHMVDTPMLDKVASEIPGLREALSQQTPIGRPSTAEEVARSAIWLGSDESSYVVGHPLLVDGGLVAQ